MRKFRKDPTRLPNLVGAKCTKGPRQPIRVYRHLLSREFLFPEHQEREQAFDPTPLSWRNTPTRPDNLRIADVNICALFAACNAVKFMTLLLQCFPNGAFQSGVRREGLGPMRAEEKTMLENMGVLRYFLLPLAG